MKKKNLLFTLLAPFLLVSCQNTPTSSVSTEDSNQYSVKVLYPDGEPVKGGVTVEWCTDFSCSRAVQVSDEGIATNTSLEDGEYYVHISNIPEGYTYNPNGYLVNAENKSTTITLSKYLSYEKGDGTKYEENSDLGPFAVKEGVYPVELSGDKPYLYYCFTPSTPGKFVIESWSLYNDTFIDYLSNVSQVIPDTPIESYDNVSDSNKNFKWEFEIPSKDYGAENSGYSVVFGISVNDKSKNAQFPLSIQCVESYEFGGKTDDEKKDDETDNTEFNTPTKYDKPADTKLKTLLTIDSNTTTFVADKEVFFNEQDKLYHVGSNDGAYLLANITSINDIMDQSFDEIQNDGIRGLTINGKDYNPLVDAYEEVVNSDGVCLVNEELKEFLDIYVKDGPGNFSILSWNGIAYDSNSWLSCCSYYDSIYETLEGNDISANTFFMNYGDLVGAYVVDVTSEKQLSLPYDDKGFTIVSSSSNARLTYNGQTYGDENGLNVTLNPLEEFSPITFKLSSNSDEKELKIKIYLGDINVKRANEGENTIDVSKSGEEILFIASSGATYNFTAEKNSNVILEINGNTYNSSEQAIDVNIQLTDFEQIRFILKPADNQDSTLSFSIKKILNAQVGYNDLSFSELSLIQGIQMKFKVQESAKYIFSVSSYYTSTFTLKINGKKYVPNQDGTIAILSLEKDEEIDLFAELDSLEEAYVNLSINKVGFDNLIVGDNNLKLTYDSETYSADSYCVFKAPSEGVYTFSTASSDNGAGAILQYGENYYGPVSNETSSIEFTTASLNEGEEVVFIVSYGLSNYTADMPMEFTVLLNIQKL